MAREVDWRKPYYAPLEWAITSRRPDMVALLLDHLTTFPPRMVFMAVLDTCVGLPEARKKSEEIFRLLVARGVLEQQPENDKGLLLHLACLIAQNIGEVQVLLDHGYKPTALGPDGKTTVIELVRRATEGKTTGPQP